MSRKIDTDNPLPRYFQVYNSLLERIHSGEFSGEQPLPPERQLTRDYGVSRITIVKAMDKLKHEGVIDRQHGRGTFVRSPKLVNQSLGESVVSQQNFFDQLQQPGQVTLWQVLDRGYFPAPPKVAEWFQLEDNSLHFQTTLLLKTAGEPVGYHHTGVRRELAIRDKIELLDDAALLDYLRHLPEQYDCQCQRGFEARPAGEEEARWLGVAVGSPILMIDLLYTDAAGQVVQFMRSFFRGDRFRYSA